MRTETVSFPGPDRRAINCLVYRPGDEVVSRATVLLVPGRPLFPTDYEWLIRPMVESGYTVVGLYQRGFGSDGVDDRAGPKTIAGIRRAASTLLEKAGLPGPLAIVGHSTGAQAALLAAAQEPRFRAAIALSPIADLAAHVKALRSYLPDIEEEHRQLFGDPFEDEEEAYRVRSPLYVAQRIDIPVLIVSGDRDLAAPSYQAEALHDAFRHHGATSKYVSLPWLGHHFEAVGFHGHQFEPVIEETLGWLDAHLPLPVGDLSSATVPDDLAQTQRETRASAAKPPGTAIDHKS